MGHSTPAGMDEFNLSTSFVRSSFFMLKLDMSVRKCGAVLAHRSANSVLGPRGKPRGLFNLEGQNEESYCGGHCGRLFRFYSGGSTWRSWVQRWTFVLPSCSYEELCIEAHDRCEEEYDRHQPDGESICSCLFWRWLLVYCCRIVRRVDGRQCCLRCCD